MVWGSELLNTNHEVPGSIPGSTMFVFSLKEEGDYGLRETTKSERTCSGIGERERETEREKKIYITSLADYR